MSAYSLSLPTVSCGSQDQSGGIGIVLLSNIGVYINYKMQEELSVSTNSNSQRSAGAVQDDGCLVVTLTTSRIS